MHLLPLIPAFLLSVTTQVAATHNSNNGYISGHVGQKPLLTSSSGNDTVELYRRSEADYDVCLVYDPYHERCYSIQEGKDFFYKPETYDFTRIRQFRVQNPNVTVVTFNQLSYAGNRTRLEQGSNDINAYVRSFIIYGKDQSVPGPTACLYNGRYLGRSKFCYYAPNVYNNPFLQSGRQNSKDNERIESFEVFEGCYLRSASRRGTDIWRGPRRVTTLSRKEEGRLKEFEIVCNREQI